VARTDASVVVNGIPRRRRLAWQKNPGEKIRRSALSVIKSGDGYLLLIFHPGFFCLGVSGLPAR
jgi:hypothetical protein